jgi:hypothetical protein
MSARALTRRDDSTSDPSTTAASVAERTVVRFEIKMLVALAAMLIAIGGWVAVQSYRLDDVSVSTGKLSGELSEIRRVEIPSVAMSARADAASVRSELQGEIREMRGEVRMLTSSINQLVGRMNGAAGTPIRSNLKE